MHRKTFLTFASLVPMLVGALALFAPAVLIVVVKGAETNGAAEVMARTVGVLLLSIGLVTFLVRGDSDSPTLRAVMIGNLVIQLALMPIDPLAYANGVFVGLGSFVPNTLLHLGLAAAFAYYLRAMHRSLASGSAVLTQA